MDKKLTRSDNKMIAGVCSGFAEYLDVDPTVVRIAFAALTFFTAFSGALFYLIAWMKKKKKTYE